MKLNQPLVFEPLLMERVWGGRRLEMFFGKKLPQGARIGESWELVDREEAQSVVHSGPLRGKTLGELWSNHRAEIFGARYEGQPGRFPLLFKLLDAEERLSVQVHPPASIAPLLGGEPKTEMWYVAWAQAEADLFVGLKEDVSRESFSRALKDGTVSELLHRIPTQAGDCIFIPSGRVHAIGAGNVIVEVQQNSDTTYRVFDWNRVGLDGKPRELHIEESLKSIDFNDFEPQLRPRPHSPLVTCNHFTVDEWDLDLDAPREGAPAGDFAVITVLSGAVQCGDEEFAPGTFFLLTASQEDRLLRATQPGTRLLKSSIP